MLTSKEIIERTGISRATLNNYIASGLVARPDVLPPAPEDGDAPRIGYFPDDTINRIESIQRLKREGWSIARIAQHLASGAATALRPTPEPALSPAPATAHDAARGTPPPARARSPRLESLAITVGTLENAHGLWTRLSAQEYFELANEVWAALESLFRSHGALFGRHPDEGMVCYFRREPGDAHLAAALAAAHASRDAMRELDRRWQERKRWDVRIAMNFGVDEGEAWVGTIGPDELRVLGEPMDRAAQMSRCGQAGAILATRGLLGKLTPANLARLSFAAPGGADARALNSFAPLAVVCPGVAPALATVAVAEILELHAPGQGS